MCGIAGAINYKKDAEGISLSLNQSIIHRGPDDQSVYIDKNNNICLTMTRLSIIGLTEGRQPKISDDEKVIVFFNGEIFNYKELNKIFFKNKNFKSDTEIILNMYLLFDLSMLKHLNGMFTISIYDKRNIHWSFLNPNYIFDNIIVNQCCSYIVFMFSMVRILLR